MKKLIYFSIFLCLASITAQENINYQQPPDAILDLVDVQRAPSVRIDDAKEFMVLLSRDPFKSIAELSKEELRLGGLRIDPQTNIGSRVSYYTGMEIKNMLQKNATGQKVQGLPAQPKIANLNWSPDQKKMAFTHTTNNGVELWVLDIATAQAKKLTEAKVNANLGDVINWFKDGQSILIKMTSDNVKPLINSKTAVPSGPTISMNDGKKAQNRTYQDLLKNKSDEFNFEQLATSTLYAVSLDGNMKQWLAPAIYSSVNFSPDGNYVMITTVEKPFSYLVPYRRFPSKSNVYAKDGKKIKTVLEVALIEDLPKGFMAVRKGPRNLSWRSDKGATLVYAQALDGGDPAQDVAYRDEVFEQAAPFTDKPRSILKTINRYSGILWGNDEYAVAYDSWFNNRNTKTYVFNPGKNSTKPKIIVDRNSQDIYSNPGRFVTKKNEFGSYVMDLDGANAFLIGAGFTDKGQFPFVDKMNLNQGKKMRLYESDIKGKKENVLDYDRKKNRLLVSIESPVDYPNYYFRKLKGDQLSQLSFFENPFKSIQNVHKEVINYKRDDGLDLSGTLYLPVGYDRNKKEKMPMILWAYPTEFKDKSSAGQNNQNPNEFTYPSYGSMVYWVTRGYVVLDDASFPIIGEGNTEPNDSFRKQLVANGKAAIDAVDKLGYIDRDKVAVGGHSYGAFMVANLLSHSDLFAAGIARSGAYNRTLTPFGFQREERSFWEAPGVYYDMSPFMHAEKMKTPMLLIHGAADNNSGTYPMQSERYFNALKGLGATARLVMLPKESHGYRSKESILHLLWEQDAWLEKYVKNRKVEKPIVEEPIKN